MYRETTQPSLLSQVRDLNDAGAWRTFDAKYRGLILRYCRRRGLQPSDAEDVQQLVMLNLAKALREFQYQPERGRFRDYLGRVVENSVRRFLRRPKVDPVRLDTDVLSDLAEPPDRERKLLWEREWMLHHYRVALEHIRAGFDRRSVDIFEGLLVGRSVAELADSYDLSENAVHKVKQRIRLRLKEAIAKQLYDEELPQETRAS
jgi:RNA polymerase sigma-70 factor (ECF subfamily)